MGNKYYQKIKKSFQNLSEEKKEKRHKISRDRDKNISKKEKEKKRQYHQDRNKNLPEEETQKKVEYMRNYYLVHKN